jgi:hypothetical protein
MANVRPLYIDAAKAHPTAVTDSDVIEVGGIQGGSAATTIGVFNDANATTITIGGGAAQTTMTMGKGAQLATFLGSLTVTENFTVSGTTTTVDTTNLSVSDDLIILRGASSGVASDEAGVAFERGTTSDFDALVLWNEANTRFELGTFETVNGTVAPTGTLTNFSPLKVEDLLLNGQAITADGSLVITGTADTVEITTTGTNAVILSTNSLQRFSVTGAGHLVTGADNVYDIGTGATDSPRTIRADTSVIVATGGTSPVTITDGNIVGGAALAVASTGATALTLTGFGTSYGLNAGATALTTTATTIIEAINEVDAAITAGSSLAAALLVGNVSGGTDISLTSGDSLTGTAEVDIFAAAGANPVTITGGLGTASLGGAITLTGGAGDAANAGGASSLIGGVGGATGAGGVAALTAGAGGATSGVGGNVTITSGGATTGSNSGVIDLNSGGRSYPLTVAVDGAATAVALTTTAQTIVEAINELDAGGGSLTLAGTLALGNTTGANNIVITTAQSITGAAELTLVSTTTSAVTIDSGTTGVINIGVDGVNAKAITIGNETGATALSLEAGTGGLDLKAFGTTYGLNLTGVALSTTATTIIEAINENTANISGSNELSEVLSVGNTTGGTNISLTSGDILTGTAEVGITAAAGTNAVTITAGAGSGAGAGGANSLIAGAGGATGVGGGTLITAGAGGATSGVGGNVTITSGGATTGSNSGVVDLVSGGRSYPLTVAVDGAATAVVLATTAQTIIEAINENQGGIAGGSTLQLAYTAGNVITMTDANGDFDVAVTSGTPAISLDAAGASNFTVAGASLTLSTTTSGVLDIDGAGITSINSLAAINIGDDAVAQAINIGTGAAARTVTVGNAASTEVEVNAILVDINAGTGGLDLDTTGAITMNASGSGASNLTSGGNLTLAAGGFTGDLILTSPDTISITNGAGSTITIGAQSSLALNSTSGGTNIDAGADSTVNVAGDWTVLLDETQTGDGSAAGNAYALTTGIGAATTGAAAAGLGGGIIITAGLGGAGSAAAVSGVGGDACLRAGAQGATGGFGLGNHGRVCLTSGAREYFLTAAATSTAPTLATTAQTIIEAINENQAATAGASEGVEITMTAGAGGITANRFVYISANNTVLHSDASADATGRGIGVAESAIVAAASGAVKVAGIVSVFFSAGLTAINANEPVFLSETAGEATNIAPTTALAVRQVMGYIKDATGYDNGAGSAQEIVLVNGPRFENPA